MFQAPLLATQAGRVTSGNVVLHGGLSGQITWLPPCLCPPICFATPNVLGALIPTICDLAHLQAPLRACSEPLPLMPEAAAGARSW